ncbi:class I SAM-dependent methyltransferase [Streptomyces sp. NPDC050145]|uniref:class I SAM-dependent methyltransferase n=1 Tax=Streptomyces sp. NPDC050145 TaxID=3365602 RepID=UPI00378E4DCB
MSDCRTTAQVVAERRPAYLSELAQGTERFHEPRRPDCPWCGSTRLRTRLRTTDLLQHKPGSFTVDQCRACAHSFQNPRLTPEGLDFYHRDFYDGLRAEHMRRVPGARGDTRRHRERARALARHIEPESWLDVGTGNGEFPAAAREELPYTAFDGADVGAGIAEARREGRVDEAHEGRLAELVPRLAGRYDALSMLHHLEHTPDPRAELRAARRVLRPGGHLLLELPDPECRYAHLLGRWWVSYFQPQHLHFIPLANLRAELAALGFTVVGVDRRAAHVPRDLTAACALFLERWSPRADEPWRTSAPTGLQRGVRSALTRASVPALLSARVADRALAPLISRSPYANAYRVIARRNSDPSS